MNIEEQWESKKLSIAIHKLHVLYRPQFFEYAVMELYPRTNLINKFCFLEYEFMPKCVHYC